MRQPPGFGQFGCTSAIPRPECIREALSADIPTVFALWGNRAGTVLDRQIRRRKHRKAEMEQQQQKEQQEQQQQNKTHGHHQPPQQQQRPPAPKKREWWRLDPNTGDKYKPVEPPATPDPTVIPTLDRIVFGWEAPLSPLEQVLQDDVRRHFPKLHEWIVRRAVERAGLLPPTESAATPNNTPARTTDAPTPGRNGQTGAAQPDPGLTDIDIDIDPDAPEPGVGNTPRTSGTAAQQPQQQPDEATDLK